MIGAAPEFSIVTVIIVGFSGSATAHSLQQSGAVVAATGAGTAVPEDVGGFDAEKSKPKGLLLEATASTEQPH